MAVIKCVNCENEILDTEIVCPYCDCPVSTDKSESYKKETSALGGETVKIAVAKDFIKEKEAIIAASRANEQADDDKKESADDAANATMKISKDDVRSDTLRRSLEEHKSRKSKGKNDHKLAILAVTVVGIFVVIYLVIGVFRNIVGEGLFEEDKGNKKAKKEVTSSAEMKELGFEFHSHTLTILDESILMEDYEANDEKPWREYIKDTTNLTIGDGVETISAYAFDDMASVRHVTLASSVSSIGNSAFYGCTKLEKIALDSEKSKLKSVGNYAFTDCSSLKSVTFGPELKRIGEGTFKSCKSLEEVTIPDSVTEIGADAFLGCHKLVIVCSEGSFAHEYATENGISVELIKSDEPTEDEPETSAPSDEKGDENQQTKPSDTTSESGQGETAGSAIGSEPSQPASSQTPAPTPEKTKDEKLAELMSQLAKAKTPEESDRILKEIDELTK